MVEITAEVKMLNDIGTATRQAVDVCIGLDKGDTHALALATAFTRYSFRDDRQHDHHFRFLLSGPEVIVNAHSDPTEIIRAWSAASSTSHRRVGP